MDHLPIIVTSIKQAERTVIRLELLFLYSKITGTLVVNYMQTLTLANAMVYIKCKHTT